MLEAKYIREHLDEVRERLALRGQAINLDGFVLIDGNGEKRSRNGETEVSPEKSLG